MSQIKRVNKALVIVLVVLAIGAIGTNIFLKLISSPKAPDWYKGMLVNKYHDLGGHEDTPALMYPDSVIPPIKEDKPKEQQQQDVQTTGSEQPLPSTDGDTAQRDPTANQIGNKLYRSDAWDPALNALYYSSADVPDKFQALQSYVNGSDVEKIYSYYSGDIQVDTQYGDAIIYVTTGDGKYTVIRLDDSGYTEFTNTAPVIALN